MGVGVGMGTMDPGEEYFRAISDGEGEAARAHALFLASRRNVST